MAELARCAVLERITGRGFGVEPRWGLHAGEGEQDPQDHRSQQDDRPCTPQEGPGAAPDLRQPEPWGGQPVARQLHGERQALAREQCAPEDRRGGQRRAGAQQVEPEQDEALQAERSPDLAGRYEGADQQRVDGQAGRAGHERGHEDRQQPVARRGQGAGGHDAGHRTSVRGQQRDERTSFEPDAGHRAVDHERGAGHVADVFEQVEHREQQDDLGQEDDDRAHPGHQAVGQEVGQPGGGDAEAHVLREHAHHLVDPVHRGGRPGKDELEEADHHRGEQERARDRVQHDPVDRLRGGVVARPLRDRVLDDRIRPAGSLEAILGRCDRGPRPVPGRREQLAQPLEAEAPVADDPDHGDSECGLEPRQVDRAAACGQLVEHGDDQAGGELATEHVADQQERALERAGVGHDQQGVGRRDVGDRAVEHLQHDGFVGADRVQAVAAWQVDDRSATPLEVECPLAAFDGDAGVVADPGAQAGEGVEQGRLACVRAPDQAEPQRRVDRAHAASPGSSRTWTRSASSRRRQTR